MQHAEEQTIDIITKNLTKTSKDMVVEALKQGFFYNDYRHEAVLSAYNDICDKLNKPKIKIHKIKRGFTLEIDAPGFIPISEEKLAKMRSLVFDDHVRKLNTSFGVGPYMVIVDVESIENAKKFIDIYYA